MSGPAGPLARHSMLILSTGHGHVKPRNYSWDVTAPSQRSAATHSVVEIASPMNAAQTQQYHPDKCLAAKDGQL